MYKPCMNQLEVRYHSSIPDALLSATIWAIDIRCLSLGYYLSHKIPHDTHSAQLHYIPSFADSRTGSIFGLPVI